MGNMLDLYRTSSNGQNSKAETLISYEETYMKLLKRYKDDIDAIENMMRELREERRIFYSEHFPAIRRELENDDVSPEIRSQWLAEIQADMEKSFHISECLIEHYVTKNLDEFKHELEQSLK